MSETPGPNNKARFFSVHTLNGRLTDCEGIFAELKKKTGWIRIDCDFEMYGIVKSRFTARPIAVSCNVSKLKYNP